MYIGNSYKSNRLNTIGVILFSSKSSRSKRMLTHSCQPGIWGLASYLTERSSRSNCGCQAECLFVTAVPGTLYSARGALAARPFTFTGCTPWLFCAAATLPPKWPYPRVGLAFPCLSIPPHVAAKIFKLDRILNSFYKLSSLPPHSSFT